MKRMLTVGLFLSILCSGYAQSGFSYQASLRNADGSLRSNESLAIDVEITRNGTAIYLESHAVETNDYGVFSIVVGQGSTDNVYSPGNIFLNTDSTALHETFLRVSEQGGNVLSETQILGVPVAEVAKVALKAHIDFPAGSIIAFGGDTLHIPEGWLFCDGSVVSREQYKDLYDAIGTAWGSGNGSTTFALPDLRGMFLRGVNYARRHPSEKAWHSSANAYMDPNNVSRIAITEGGNMGNRVGSYQDDMVQSHDHTIDILTDGPSGFGYYDNIIKIHTTKEVARWTLLKYLGGRQINPSTGRPWDEWRSEETSVKNVYVNYMIKY
jgi:hypothetical protein